MQRDPLDVANDAEYIGIIFAKHAQEQAAQAMVWLAVQRGGSGQLANDLLAIGMLRQLGCSINWVINSWRKAAMDAAISLALSLFWKWLSIKKLG